MSLKTILFKFDDICKELGIKYFLLQGTCLGLFRDHNFIKDDTDIDVFVDCSKNKLIKLFKQLEKKGFVPDKIFSNRFENAPGEEINRHVKYGTMWMDVYFKMLDNRKKFMIKPNKIRFKGRIFNCPSPVEEYLALEFGDTWETPCGQKSRGKGSLLFEPSKDLSWDELLEAKEWLKNTIPHERGELK